MAPFAQVKSSPFGARKPAVGTHIWSERTWRKMVRDALLAIPERTLRATLAETISYQFKPAEIGLEHWPYRQVGARA